LIAPWKVRKVNKAKRIIYTMNGYRNWRELILPILKGEKPKKVLLRNGVLRDKQCG